MNKFHDRLISHILQFANPYKYLILDSLINNYRKLSRQFIQITNVSRQFYRIIRNTEIYQFEQLKMNMRKCRNKHLIETKFNDLDIIIPNGLLSEAYFYIINFNLSDHRNGNIDRFITDNKNYFPEVYKKFGWTDELYGVNSAMNKLKIITNKTILNTIRTQSLQCDEVNKYNMIKISLYYYNYLQVEDTHFDFLVDISLIQELSDIIIFAIENDMSQYKKIINECLKCIYDNPNLRADIDVVAIL